MNKTPTAEEFKNNLNPYVSEENCMVEFAKLHCKAQLKVILENVEQEIACDGESTEHFNLAIKPSILNAYPLNNIK